MTHAPTQRKRKKCSVFSVTKVSKTLPDTSFTRVRVCHSPFPSLRLFHLSNQTKPNQTKPNQPPLSVIHSFFLIQTFLQREKRHSIRKLITTTNSLAGKYYSLCQYTNTKQTQTQTQTQTIWEILVASTAVLK